MDNTRQRDGKTASEPTEFLLLQALMPQAKAIAFPVQDLDLEALRGAHRLAQKGVLLAHTEDGIARKPGDRVLLIWT